MNGKQLGMLVVLLSLMVLTVQASVLDEAKVYLPFEGADTGIAGEAWRNQGTAGLGESPFVVGGLGAHTPTVAAGGVKGQAFDGSMMDALALENTYRWGEPNEIVVPPVDTALEQGLIGTYSFTVAFWIKTQAKYDQGRIIATDNWQVNYRGDYVQLHFMEEGEFVGGWINSSTDPRQMPSLDHWRFVAITYDGSTSPADPCTLKFYTGTESQSVKLDQAYDRTATPSNDYGQLDVDPEIGCRLAVGNAAPESDRPFVGFIDEVRIWTSLTDDSDGVLSLEKLEMVRSYDVGLCDGEKLAGDINGDCFVNLTDWAGLVANWMMSNQPTP